MLLRVDPDKERIALLSIPRDLRVNIPGVGVDKFNAAYSAGGPEKTLKVVKQLTGVPIHHVVNINFTGFADAVNAIGCVYVDVDRRYYIPEEDETSEINLEAGYQRMCGFNALAVRALPPLRQRPRPRRAPTGLPPRGAPEAAAGEADRGPQRTARHLHRLHDLGYRRGRAAARAAEDVRSRCSRSR